MIFKPETEIIFPYEQDAAGVKAIPETAFKKRFPLAWKHLKKHETRLRKRYGESMDGDHWYTFSRNQNLDKQKKAKIVIAGTGRRIEAAIDSSGEFSTNDKRVYSVYLTKKSDTLFLTGILNSRACNFVF